jgi:hypothetical protein
MVCFGMDGISQNPADILTSTAAVAALQDIASDIRKCALHVSNGYAAVDVLYRFVLAGGEVTEQVHAWPVPALAAPQNELVHVYFEADNLPADLESIVNVLRRELEPFVIGAGEVSVRPTDKGFVLLRSDDRLKLDGHDLAP